MQRGGIGAGDVEVVEDNCGDTDYWFLVIGSNYDTCWVAKLMAAASAGRTQFFVERGGRYH